MKRFFCGCVVLGAILGAAGQARSANIYWADNSNFGSGGNNGGDIRRANLDGTGQTLSLIHI